MTIFTWPVSRQRRVAVLVYTPGCRVRMVHNERRVYTRVHALHSEGRSCSPAVLKKAHERQEKLPIRRADFRITNDVYLQRGVCHFAFVITLQRLAASRNVRINEYLLGKRARTRL